MTFFSKPSILFVATNLVRVVSVVAICLALAGTCVIMAEDLKGYHEVKSAAPSATASLNVVRRHLDLSSASLHVAATPSVREPDQMALQTSFATHKTTPRTHAQMRKLVRRESRDLDNATSTTRPRRTSWSGIPTSTRIMTASAAATSIPACAYVGETSVPSGRGGLLFSTLEKIFCVTLLLFLLASEVPPPTRFTQMFWSYAFPPLGNTFGVGVLGVIQVFVGCTALSHAVSGFALVSFWLLFVVGQVNILFGLAFGARIKQIRSIVSDDSTTLSGLDTVRNAQAASSAYHEFDHQVRETKRPVGAAAARRLKPIVISPPQPQPAPPIYQSQGRTAE
ncbi:hypothetical protein ACM66B_000454 [Microbotryomycetes sp. NB124-2]